MKKNDIGLDTPTAATIVIVCAAVAIAFCFLLPTTHTPQSDVQLTPEEIAEQYASDMRMAASIDDHIITEGKVTCRVMVFRATNGLEDDQAFGIWLDSQQMSAIDLRTYVLDNLIHEELLEQAAQELNVAVLDQDVEAEIARNRQNYLAGWETLDEAEQEERWTNATSHAQMNGLTYEEETRVTLLEQAVANVARGEGTSYEDWYDDFATKREITIVPAPSDLPYVM